MKAVYTLNVRSGASIDVPLGTSLQSIGGAIAEWDVDLANNLVAVVLKFEGLVMILDESGRVDPAPAEFQERAYRAAIYVANRIYLQTGIDAIDPGEVLLGSPDVSAETPDEVAIFECTPRTVSKSIVFARTILGEFNPTPYDRGFKHSAAFSYYADAKRATAPLQRFELLYKVVEYFFSEKDLAEDVAVAAYVGSHDSSFSVSEIRELRFQRNRIVHPRARRGHISVENVHKVQDVRLELKRLTQLAEILLNNPTY